MTLSAAHKDDISALRASAIPTRRAVAPGLEALLYEPLPALDHGFVRVIDYMGDDAAVVQAARVSYGTGTKQVNEDAGLINYLMRHYHSTPFEMCEIKLHVKLPIFVARQWVRHRTANINEYSARYSIMDREFYLPAPEHLAAQARHNRQGRDAILTGDEAAQVLQWLKDDASRAYDHYELMLNESQDGTPRDPSRLGLARELARMNLPLNYYTQWYWKIDLHNFMSFIRLRADAHAQYEIRVYADILTSILQAWMPLTYQAFLNHRTGGAHLSQAALAALRRMLTGEPITQETSGLGKGEWRELQAVLQPA